MSTSRIGLRRIAQGLLATVVGLTLIGVSGQASAAKYRVVDGPKEVDIRVKGDRVVAFSLGSRIHCPANEEHVGGGVLVGKAFGDDMRPNIPISSSGKFAFKIGNRTDGVALKGTIVKKNIRGSFYIKSEKRTSFFGDTCWTGKSQRNAWVKFVAVKKSAF